MTKKTAIAILYGGNSSEYDISVMSANNIAASLNRKKYQVYKVLIKDRAWTAYEDSGKALPVDKNDFSINRKQFDLVFPAIHGTPGEDGQLQGYFQALNIPFSGSSLLTSALTFNKYFCNQFLRSYDVKMAKSFLIRKGKRYSKELILKHIALPCFIKPNEGGSSFGITKVKQKEDFDAAVQYAFGESDEVMAEEYIEGMEVTCGLFKTQDKEYVFAPAEIVSKNEFFDFQAKYDSNYNDEIVPARISGSLTQKVQKISSDIYDYLNCSGIVRIDYILKNEEFYFLEVNTIPGMTAESIVPKMMKHAGMTYSEAADLIINDVMQKYTESH